MYNAEETVTILDGAEDLSKSRSRLVNRKCPKWLTPNDNSNPSSVFVRFGETIRTPRMKERKF